MDGLGEEATRRLVIAAAQLKTLQDEYVTLQQVIDGERRATRAAEDAAQRADFLTERHRRQHDGILHAIDALNRKSAKVIEENKLLDEERNNLQARLAQSHQHNRSVCDEIARLVEEVKVAEGERQRATIEQANAADAVRTASSRKRQSQRRSAEEGSVLNRLRVQSGKCNYTSQFVESVLSGV
jgi:hypothetical protein